MDKTQFRIGNKVTGGTIMELHSTLAIVSGGDSGSHVEHYEKIVPILLTKEWLIRFGFSDEVWAKLKLPIILGGLISHLVCGEYGEDGYIFMMEEEREQFTPKKVQFEDAQSEFAKDPSFDFDNQGWIDKESTADLAFIKYVHEFQNFYFSLTKQEPVITY